MQILYYCTNTEQHKNSMQCRITPSGSAEKIYGIYVVSNEALATQKLHV